LSNLWIASSACILQQDQLRSRSSGLGWVTFLGYHGIPHSNHEKIMTNPYPLQRYEYLGSNAWGCGWRS
jgi:hypothetical protein